MKIKRFSGTEIWVLTDGGFSMIENSQGLVVNFWCHSEGKLISEPLSDNNEYRAEPLIEIQFDLPVLQKDRILNQEICVVAEGENYYSNLYYYGHQEIHSINLKVDAQEKQQYRVRFSCLTTDVNFYDGTKPENEITIDCSIKLSNEKTGYWTEK